LEEALAREALLTAAAVWAGDKVQEGAEKATAHLKTLVPNLEKLMNAAPARETPTPEEIYAEFGGGPDNLKPATLKT